MANGSFVLLEDRGVLGVSGPDRYPFLQGLVSNDVEKVSSEAVRYAALLTAQGRYLHDFVMVEAGESIWLDAEACRIGDLQKRLSVYRLRAKVSLEEKPELAVAAVFGEHARAVLELHDAPGAARVFGSGVAFVDPRLSALGARVILPRDRVRMALIALGLAEADFATYDHLRLSLGIPDSSRDLVPEKSILLDAGFDELNGIDWQKGCYVGQELTARTKYRALTKRRLMPVEIRGPAPAPGAIVTADGHEVGEMRSSCEGLGLALLRIEPVLGGKTLEAGGTLLVAVRPAWMRLDTEAAPVD
jgi:folate-binding protein YgfZ